MNNEQRCGTCAWWKRTGPECGVCEALIGRADVPEWAWRAANSLKHKDANCNCWKKWDEPMDPMEEALSLLKTAASIAQSIVDKENPPDMVDSVTWRIADALMILREYAEARWPGSRTPGVNFPTGRGAILADHPKVKPTNSGGNL